MSYIERKINAYKMFIDKNCLNAKTTSYFIDNEGSEFESQIKKIFEQKKFFINNQYDFNGVKIFLEEKDECLKKIELDDSVLFKNLNVDKRSKNEKNQNEINKDLAQVNDKEKTEIKNNNQIVIDSFISSKSADSIEEMLVLLKETK